MSQAKEYALDNPAFVKSPEDASSNAVQTDNNVVKSSVDNTRYGYGPFKPRCIQVFNKIWVFAIFLTLFCLVYGFAVIGLTSISLSTIERHFRLSSSKSGLIPSADDIGAVSVMLFLTYIGGRYNKVTLIASGACVMAVGSFVFIIPHLATDYNYGAASEKSGITDMCQGDGPQIDMTSCESGSGGVKWLGVFMVAMIIHGIGFSPLFPFGAVYLNDNADPATASVYVGICFAASALGTALGILTGGQIMQNFYVDFDRVDQDSLGFGADDPRWVGAWWLGYVISTVGFLLVALPLFGFPKYLPSCLIHGQSETDMGQKSDNNTDQKPNTDNTKKPGNDTEHTSGNDVEHTPGNDTEHTLGNDTEQTPGNDTEKKTPDDDTQQKQSNGREKKTPDNGTAQKPDNNNSGSGLIETILGFLKAFVRLAKNPTFVCATVATCAGNLRTFGIIPFIFKYLTEMYNLDFTRGGGTSAGMIVCAALGYVLGGALVRIFKLDIVGMLRMAAIVSALACLFSIGFLLKCPDIKLAGMEVPYPNETGVTNGYIATCNMGCNCENMTFNPVCGVDGIVYYSGCHAGCLAPPTSTQEPYTNCSCVASSLNRTVSDDVTASLGRCEDGCYQMNVFIPLLYLMAICSSAIVTPAAMITIRCVDDDMGPFALGVHMVLIRLLGKIPGPVLFGAIIDRSCVIWTGESCDSSGVCTMYNKSQMSRGTLLLYLIISVITTVFFVVGSIIASRKTVRGNNYSPETKDPQATSESPGVSKV